MSLTTIHHPFWLTAGGSIFISLVDIIVPIRYYVIVQIYNSSIPLAQITVVQSSRSTVSEKGKHIGNEECVPKAERDRNPEESFCKAVC